MSSFVSHVLVRIMTAFAMVAACATVAFAIRPRLPKPTGPVPVGTSVIALDAFTTKGKPIVGCIWYPAEADRGPYAAYALGATGLPTRDRLVSALVRTDARRNNAVRAGRAPVIIYIPGLGGRRFHNTALAQDLASHGYIVVAVDDTQPSVGFDFSSEAGIQRTLIEGDRKVRLQARDIASVLDALAKLDAAPSGILSHRLSLERVGVLGFSFGGAVAAEIARKDRRVAAAVDLDGSIFGEVRLRGVSKPFLFMTGRNEIESVFEATFDRENIVALVRGLERSGGYMATVDGMDHNNFSDAAVLPSLRHTGVGSIDGERGMQIIARNVRFFFDRYIRGETARRLGGHETADAAVSLREFGGERQVGAGLKVK